MNRDIDFVVNSLAKVLANGHGVIPVPCQDLRLLIDAVRQERARCVEIARSMGNDHIATAIELGAVMTPTRS
jgi:urease accessory protein UreE